MFLLREQRIDTIQSLVLSIAVEAIIADHRKAVVGDMNEQFLEKASAGFRDVYSDVVLMPVIEPMNHIRCFIKGDNSAFCHGRSCGIAHDVIDSILDVPDIVYFSAAGLAEIIFRISGIDIESILLGMVDLILYSLEGISEAFRHETKQLVLESQAELLEIKVGKGLHGIGIRIIDKLRHQRMNVRIPLDVSAEGMKAGNHAKVFLVAKVLVQIVSIRIRNKAALEPAVDPFVDDAADRVPGSDKQKTQGITIFPEPGSQFERNGKYNMTVRGINSHLCNLGCQQLLLLDAAGVAETGMTFVKNKIAIPAFRTFKGIIAKIFSIAEQRLVDIVHDGRTLKISGFFQVLKPIQVVPENIGYPGLVWIIGPVINVLDLTPGQSIRIERFADHD